MKRIAEESSQNVNSNAGIFLAKQILDAIPSFGKFDSCQPSLKSVACQTYSNSGVAKAEVALMTLGKTSFCDIDVSVLVNDNSRKENVGFTYHRIDGFAPIFATLGRLGYQLANEMRPGNQHSQKGFPEFLRRSVGLVRRITDRRILLRVDSGHDADGTLATGFELDDEIRSAVEGCGLDFNVKRNARREDERMWIEQANGERGEPAYSYDDERDGRVDVFRGVVSHLRTKSTGERPLFCVWEVKRMRRDDELFPRYATATWWTNLPEDADTVVWLYHDHTTCEQFHSELKTDMDVERLPSGDYRTNSLILSLSTLAFNVLRRIGQTVRNGDACLKTPPNRPQTLF